MSMNLGSVSAVVSVLVKTILDKNSVTSTGADITKTLGDAGAKSSKSFLQNAAPNIKQGISAVVQAAIVQKSIQFVKDSISEYKDLAKEVRGIQRVAGGSAEDISRLNFAFKSVGMTSAQAVTSFKFLSRNQLAAKEQLKKYNDELTFANKHHKKFSGELGAQAQIFKTLGISITDPNGKMKDLNTLLLDTSAAFMRLPNGAEKTALAMKLFGKQGTALLPILNKGKVGIEELGNESDKFGFTLSQQELDAAKVADLSAMKFKHAWEGVKITLGKELSPAVDKLATDMREKFLPVIEKIIKFLVRNQGAVQGVVLVLGPLIAVTKTLTTLYNIFGPVLGGAFKFIKLFESGAKGAVIVTKAWAVVQKVFNAVWAQSPIGRAVIVVTLLAAAFIYAYKHFKGFRDGVDKGVKALISVFKALWKIIQLAFKFSPAGLATMAVKKITGKAVGGPVQSGTEYLVGEKGPELFRPNVSGTIIPNNKLSTTGNGKSEVYNIVINNPQTERSSTSIPRALRNANYLKGGSN